MTGSAPVAILPITRSKSQRLLVNYKDITWKLLTKKKKALPTCFCFFTECTESIMFWYLYRTYAKVQKPCKKLPQNTRPTQVFWDSVTHTHTHAHTHTPSSIIFTIIWSAWHWYCGIIPSCCNVIMNRFVILIPIICVWMCVCVCVCVWVCVLASEHADCAAQGETGTRHNYLCTALLFAQTACATPPLPRTTLLILEA